MAIIQRGTGVCRFKTTSAWVGVVTSNEPICIFTGGAVVADVETSTFAFESASRVQFEFATLVLVSFNIVVAHLQKRCVLVL